MTSTEIAECTNRGTLANRSFEVSEAMDNFRFQNTMANALTWGLLSTERRQLRMRMEALRAVAEQRVPNSD